MFIEPQIAKKLWLLSTTMINSTHSFFLSNENLDLLQKSVR